MQMFRCKDVLLPLWRRVVILSIQLFVNDPLATTGNYETFLPDCLEILAEMFRCYMKHLNI